MMEWISVEDELRLEIKRLEEHLRGATEQALEDAYKIETLKELLGECPSVMRKVLICFSPEHLDSVSETNCGTQLEQLLTKIKEVLRDE